MSICITCGNNLNGRQQKYCSSKCKSTNTNNIHQNYAAQQKRGLRIKLKLISLKGGQCERCGYNKNHAALCFHHNNDKLFKLDLRQCSNTKWEKLVEEVQKCNLLCHNCHMEEHYPHYTLVPPA